jgi:hypothetical protein
LSGLPRTDDLLVRLSPPDAPATGTKLVITSPAFTSPASTLATNAITITLEDAHGNPTTNATSFKIELGGNSYGRRFSATSGGAAVNYITLPANTQSVTVFYGDTNAGIPTITVSLTTPASNAGLLEGTQTETIS